MDLATLFVRFKADTSAVDKSVKQLETNTVKSAGSIAKSLAGAFSAAVIGAGIKHTIDSASDLNETVSKTEVIFGNASAAVIKVGDTAAKSMGLSKTAYLDAASGLKGLLDNLGLTSEASTKWSQDLVGLGSDLGSFFNKDPAVAIEAIQSALRGESEPIRAFNVQISDAAVKAEALKEGLYDGVGAIDANAKAQATLALIMQQTTAAQGDFARTADGAANSQRIAKAEMENTSASIGQALLPAYTKVVQIVGDVAAVFGSLPGPVQTAIVALVGLVALSGPISSLIEVVGGIKEAMAGLSVSAGGLALVAAGIAAAIVLFSSSDDSHKQVSERAKEVAVNLKTETDAIVKQRLELGTAVDAATAFADAQTAISKSLTGSDVKGQALAKALGAIGLQATDAADVIKLLQVRDGDLITSQGDLATATKNGADATIQAELAHRDLFVALLATKGISSDVAKVLFEAGSGATYMGDAADVTKDKTKGWSDENRQLLASIIEVGKQAGNTDIPQIATDYLNGEVAASKFKGTLVAQAEAQVGASRASQDATAVYDAYLKLLENLTPEQQKQLDATDAQAAALPKLTAATTDTANAMDTLAVRQDQAKASADANKDATDALKKALDKEKGSTDAARKAADDFGKALDTVFGASLDLEEANRNLAAGFADVAQAIKDNGNTLDINTDKGRANRSSIEDQVKTINEKIKADIASGVSIEAATAAGEAYRQTLIDTSGSTDEARAAAEDYINQLGLTPENISTAVELTHDEQTKQRLADLLDQMGDIDAGAAAEIRADIDQGKFDEAEAALNKLARDRPVLFVPTGSFSSGNVAGPKVGKSSQGRYVGAGTNFLTTVSEPGTGDEVIMPLTDPARMRELAAGNGVGSRILAALVGAQDDSSSVSTPMSVSSSTTSVRDVTLNNYRQDLTIDDVNTVIAMARLL